MAGVEELASKARQKAEKILTDRKVQAGADPTEAKASAEQSVDRAATLAKETFEKASGQAKVMAARARELVESAKAERASRK